MEGEEKGTKESMTGQRGVKQRGGFGLERAGKTSVMGNGRPLSQGSIS